jgi:hypothetical protein
MTDKQRQIANYISLNRVLSLYVRPASTLAPRTWPHAVHQQLPPLDEFRQELLEDAEFRALQLGDWLRTTDGQVIAEAVSMVIPPAYGPAYELAVQGLTLAAEDQAQEGREAAGAVALVTLLVVAAIVLVARNNP